MSCHEKAEIISVYVTPKPYRVTLGPSDCLTPQLLAACKALLQEIARTQHIPPKALAEAARAEMEAGT